MKPSQTASNAPAPETVVVDDHADQVACDGGGGPLGHPRVYYAFDNKPMVECLYCDRVFVKASEATRRRI